jgi:uncharacterized ferritin-like protein (DUF455 family)
VFFERVREALEAQNSVLKIELTTRLYDEFVSGKFDDFEDSEAPKVQQRPSCEAFCEIVGAKTVLKRKNISQNEGKQVFLHAVTHIEYSAIDLALDACYTFRGLPKEFYADWLEVAKEECEHFLMLQSLLNKVGAKYGDYPVHISLFEACRKADTLLKRMAAIPRYLEAGGLDANKKMVERVKNAGGELVDEIVQALGIILRDEIDHVKKGTKWFYYACEQEGVSPDVYFDTVDSVLPNSIKPKENINIEDRLKAGFKCEEIKKIIGKEAVPC